MKDKVWAYHLDRGASGYGCNATWGGGGGVLPVGICFYLKRRHQRNLDPLDLLERGSSECLMMNLLEILAVGPLVVPLVEPLEDDPLLVEPLVVSCKDAPLLVDLLKYDSHLQPLDDDDSLLVELLYDGPLLGLS